MISEIKTILYATDLSKNAIHAFSYAAAMANRFEASINILHVIEELSHSANIHVAQIMGEDKWKALQDENVQKVRDEINRRLDAFCEMMTAKLTDCPFIVTDIFVEHGEPVERILSLAGKTVSDLIVMGTHGQGLVADAMLGSTARRVVRRSTLPVMTFRLPE